MAWGLTGMGAGSVSMRAAGWLSALGVGAVAMAIAFTSQVWLLQRLDWLCESRLGAAATAALFEESAKLLAVLALALMLGRRRSVRAALSLGVVVGLGAGAAELAWHLHVEAAAGGAWATLGSGAVRLAMHGLWGASSGYAVGRLLIDRRGWPGPGTTFGLALLLHFAWDASVGYAEQQTTLHRVLAQGLLMLTLALYARQQRRADTARPMRWPGRPTLLGLRRAAA